jgi:hypothetical protein
VILGLHGHAPLSGDETRPFRDRPALQDPVELESEIPVHATRRVLLNDELQ